MDIAEFKQQNPAYKDVPDLELADALHAKYYSEVPREQFLQQVGLAGPGGNFAASMPRADYAKQFIANNPKADQSALDMALAQYDKAQRDRTEAHGNAAQDKFKQMASPDATFNARLNQRLQGPANGIVPPLPAKMQPDKLAAPKREPSLAATIGANTVGGLMGGLAGAGAAAASLVGADETAAGLDAAREAIDARRMDEYGGDTITGRASALVGGIAPALAAPAELVPQLAVNAGLFAIPAFRDTYKAKIAQGQSENLALIHAAEAAGINLVAPTVASKGMGAVVGKLGGEGLAGLPGAATQLGTAAAEGVGFSALNTVADKGTDLLAGQKNDAAWIDPKDMAANALGFGVLRAPRAVGVALAPRATVADIAKAQTVDEAIAAATAAVPSINTDALKAGNDANVADLLRSIRPLEPKQPEPAAPAEVPVTEGIPNVPADALPAVDGMGRGAGADPASRAGLEPAVGRAEPVAGLGDGRGSDADLAVAGRATGVPAADGAAHPEPALAEAAESAHIAPDVRATELGHPIDADWHAFPDAAEGKNIPRADMPQIAAEHRGALTQFLAARGITHEPAAEYAPESFKPAQREFSPEKVEKARNFEGGDRSILVSSDGHVLDGHHQWLAKMVAGEPVSAIRLNAPIHDLIERVREFPSAFRSEGAEKVLTPELAKGAEILSAMKPNPVHGRLSVVDPATMTGGAERTITPEHAQFVQALGRALGKDVVFFKQEGNKRRLDGMANTEHPDTIFVNVAKGDAAWHVVAGHEFFHQMPDHVRTSFIEAVKPLIKAEQFNALKKYVNQPHLDDAGHWEEIAADLFGNRFTEPGFFDKVLGNIGDKSTAAKVFDYLRAFLDRIAAIAKGQRFATDAFVTDLDKIRASAADALGRYLEARQEPEPEKPMRVPAGWETRVEKMESRLQAEIAKAKANAAERAAARAAAEPSAEASAEAPAKASEDRAPDAPDAERDHFVRVTLPSGHSMVEKVQAPDEATALRKAEAEHSYAEKAEIVPREEVERDYPYLLEERRGGQRLSDERAEEYTKAVADGRKREALRILHDALDIKDVDATFDRGGLHTPAGPEDGSPLYDVSRNGTYPEDVYSHNGLLYYSTGEDKMDAEAYQIIKRLEGHPNVPLTIYRAVEKDGPNKIQPGDWVTIVRDYAKDHGEANVPGGYKIISARVYARDIFTAGDSWLEWGYHPQEFKPELPKGERKFSPLNERIDAWKARQEAQGGDTKLSDERDKVEVDGTLRPTTNSSGRPLATSEEGVRNFWRWFGDSAVVDDQGRPMVVYHGTAGDFAEFDAKKSSAASMHATAYLGHYFSASPDVANEFVPRREDMSTWPPTRGPREGGNVMPAYLNISKPYEMPLAEFREMVPNGRSKSGIEQARALRADLERQGYDGIHIPGDPALKDSMAGDEWHADTWIAFEPEQIKSATGNAGTFDPESADIRYSQSRADELKDKLSRMVAIPKGALHSAATSIRMQVMPMTAGGEHAMAFAKDFANSTRKAQLQWAAFDKVLTKHYTEEELGKMWRAADEENDLRREGKTSKTKGLASLTANQRATVELLHAYGEELWAKAKKAGMVEGDGVAFWTPRVAARIYADGSADSIRSAPGEFSKEARNLRTSASSTKQRNYDTTAESEAALKAKLGDDAEYVKNIRVMPMAMAQLEKAIAGRTLINQIKAHGQVAGQDLVREGDTGDKNYATFDHPAMKRWAPKMDWRPADEVKMAARGYTVQPDGVYTAIGDKLASYRVKSGVAEQLQPLLDETGKPVLEAKPLFVHKEFIGPLKSVFTTEPNKVYRGLMEMKSLSMNLIMISPMTHNMVIWGKALPSMVTAMGWKGNLKNLATGGLYTYFVGNKVRQDHALMGKLVEGGLVPMGGRGMNPDLPAIAGGIAPGKSLLAKAIGAVFDVAHPKVGEAARKSVDAAGKFWHETLLWDRVADMQAGMAVQMRNHFMDKGIDEDTATRIAAFFANRYGGAIPHEAISESAHALMNITLFSKSFTLTNAGAMKDPFVGLPKEVRAQIRLRAIEAQKALGKTDIEAVDAAGRVLRQAQSVTRKKAWTILLVDFGAMAALTSLAQAYFAGQSGQQFKDDLLERAERLGVKLDEDNPLAFLGPQLGKIGLPLAFARHPFENLEALSQTSDNPHGKEDRVRIGEDEQGNSYYLRIPTGKVVEEMKHYSNLDTQTKLLNNKLSPLAKSVVEAAHNEDFQGRRVYQPGDNLVKQVGAVVAHVLKAQVPFDDLVALKHVASGDNDQGGKVRFAGRDWNMDEAKLLGTATGLSVSKVAGGDTVAEMRYHNREQQAALHDVLPDVRELVRRGEEDEALQKLVDAGQTVAEARGIMRSIENPTRISRTAQQKFARHASEEQQAKLDRIRNR